MVKNIIFDLSEVIISGYHGVENLIAERYKIQAREFKKQKEININLFFELMRGKVTEDEYLKELTNNTNWNISIKELKNVIRDNLNIPVDGTMDIIKRLKGKYKLILLSDHVKEWIDYILENNQELSIFDEMFFSYNLGRVKSDKNTFTSVLEDLNIKADETIFIDDSQINIDRARAQGIKGILFSNAKKLEEDLKFEYNIL